MTNVLDEIEWNLKENNLTEQDISWIGSLNGEYAMSWDEFKNKFKDIDYNNGFGAQELADDLVIVMKDYTYFTRWEYDGSEGWNYNKVPVKSGNPKPFKYISVKQLAEIGWKSLKELNSKETANCKTCDTLMITNDYSKGDCFNCRRDKEYENYQKTGKWGFEDE